MGLELSELYPRQFYKMLDKEVQIWDQLTLNDKFETLTPEPPLSVPHASLTANM